jgi:hypothetical protein
MKSLKKKPIQIYIEPQQDYVLENLAKKRGLSKAEIIRKSLDKFLREIPLEEDPENNGGRWFKYNLISANQYQVLM